MERDMGSLFGGGQKQQQPQVIYQQPAAAAVAAPAAASVNTDAKTKDNTTDASKLQAAKRSTLLSEADANNNDLLGS